MANTTAVSVQFKTDIMVGTHNLSSGGSGTINAALYVTTATINGSTTTYSSTNEVTGTNYSAGGVAITNGVSPTSSGTTAYWTPSASIVYTNVTLSTAFDTVLLYYTSDNHAIGDWNFGSTTVTAGTLTLTMPTNDSTHALLQLN